MEINKVTQVFAFENQLEVRKYKSTIDDIWVKIKAYLQVLENEYSLIDYPKVVVWTTNKLATTVFSNVPIPAYTNERFICIAPELDTWKELYREINRDVPNEKVANYHNNITSNLVLQLLGHEFTHHLDLFLDDFEGDRYSGIWFEEGMCEYLSRKYLLSDEEFKYVSHIEWEYIMYYKGVFGNSSIEEFGSESYGNSMEKIMCDYYVSFHTVKKIVDVIGMGNPKVVFELYKKWDEEERKTTLSEYFDIDIFN